jgi:hypothetical protein
MPDLKVIRQIIRAVVGNLPNVRCYQCLSLQVGVSEKDVREAAQLLVVNNGFVITAHTCQVCARTDMVLASGKSDGDVARGAGQLMSTVTLNRTVLRIRGVDPDTLGAVLTRAIAQALRPFLESHGFDLERPIHVQELPERRGFRLTQ